MTYEQNVQAAATALKQGEDANWELARLTYENTRDRTPSEHLGKVTMEQWARDVRAASGRKLAVSTAIFYKRVWSRTGQSRAIDRPSWTEALHEVRGDTVLSHGERRAKEYVASSTPETKREIFYRLAQDEEVVNRETLPTVRETIHQRTRDVLDMPPVPQISPEQIDARHNDNRTGISYASAAAQLDLHTAAAITAAEQWRDVLLTMGALGDTLRAAEAQTLRYVIDLWQANLDTLVDGSTVDAVDAFLKGNR